VRGAGAAGSSDMMRRRKYVYEEIRRRIGIPPRSGSPLMENEREVDLHDAVRRLNSAVTHIAEASPNWPKWMSGERQHGFRLLLVGMHELADAAANGRFEEVSSIVTELDIEAVQLVAAQALLELGRLEWESYAGQEDGM
jgi:hypothetical protein